MNAYQRNIYKKKKTYLSMIKQEKSNTSKESKKISTGCRKKYKVGLLY